MLKEALENKTSDKVLIDYNVFKSHKHKCEKAIEKLGSNFKSVYDMNDFLREEFGIWPLWFGTSVSHQTRLNCAFVDYRNEKWVIGANIDSIKFVDLINQVEQRTNKE